MQSSMAKLFPLLLAVAVTLLITHVAHAQTWLDGVFGARR